MARGPFRLFAGRRITLTGVLVTIATVFVAFGVGIAAGWATSLIASNLSATEPTDTGTASASPSPTPSMTPSGDVSVPPMTPVTREIDDDDKAAGLRTLDFPYQADGTFTPVPVKTEATPPADGLAQYVRIDVEDGLAMIDGTLSTFVMSALNDPQGWGKDGPTTYLQTDGAPDVRIIFASPYTAAALCPTPHEPASLTPAASPSPSPSLTPPTGFAVQCAEQGAIVVSVYNWIQGLEAFGEDRTAARVYFLNHGLGHVLGKPDTTCSKGVADVMVNQAELPAKCTANPWPFPTAN
jgi:hypothetical protein